MNTLVEIKLPNSGSQHALRKFLFENNFFPDNVDQFSLNFHPSITYLQPFAISMLAAWGDFWINLDKSIVCKNTDKASINYVTRMGLFQFLNTPAPRVVTEHEPSGQFIPLKKIKHAQDLKEFLADIVPLLHSPSHAKAVTYVLSELIRNVLEHAGGNPAFACAQYYKKSNRVSIGVADCGIGIMKHLSSNYTFKDNIDYVIESLKPGVTGSVPTIYGSPENAGAGLFYTKSIALASGQYFSIYSGNAAYRLRKNNQSNISRINIDPLEDRHDKYTELPSWNGTVVAVDIGQTSHSTFDKLLDLISAAYSRKMGLTKKPEIRFT